MIRNTSLKKVTKATTNNPSAQSQSTKHSVAHIADQFVNLFSTGIVGDHHRVEGGVTDRCVTVSDVHSDFFQRFVAMLLGDRHAERGDKGAQLLQTLCTEKAFVNAFVSMQNDSNGSRSWSSSRAMRVPAIHLSSASSSWIWYHP